MNSTSDKLLVGILMGSDSDWPVMKAAADALTEFGIASEAKVISAHRDPRGLEEYVSCAFARHSRKIVSQLAEVVLSRELFATSGGQLTA